MYERSWRSSHCAFSMEGSLAQCIYLHWNEMLVVWICALWKLVKRFWVVVVRVVFLLAVNGLGQILQGHLWLLMKFLVPSWGFSLLCVITGEFWQEDVTRRGWVKFALCCPGLLGVREQDCTSGLLFANTFCAWPCQRFSFWKNSGIGFLLFF